MPEEIILEKEKKFIAIGHLSMDSFEEREGLLEGIHFGGQYLVVVTIDLFSGEGTSC
jgi:hypothetical protein